MSSTAPTSSSGGLVTREVLEDREDAWLAPYAFRSRDSEGRIFAEAEDPLRTAFQRDRDRIVHSTAFRRLEYKTQVFVNHEGDHYRTRLTHTMEVAQIARSISRSLLLNEDLAETVALVHDLGHPPFGHSGERALSRCMEGHGGFEHNEQALRVVDVLESRYPERPGLNLTHEVRESILKHTTFWDQPREESASESDFEDLPPLLEAQVVDEADMIAYNNHDVDDGLYSGLLDERELSEVRLVRDALAEVDRRWPGLPTKMRRRRMVTALIDSSVRDLIEESARRLHDSGVGSAEEARRSPRRLIAFSGAMWDKQKELASFLERHFYESHRVIRMADKAERFIQAVFEAYVDDPRQLPPEFARRAETDGLHRSVCDYVAGMTDRYAQDTYKKLFHPFERI